MTVLSLIGFSGEVPRLQPRQLADAAATHAQNVRLDSGGLWPIRKAKHTHTFTGMTEGSIKSIYLHQSTWMAWTTHVSAAPGPIASDRLYITGDGAPKMRVGAVTYDLAVNPPAGALTAALVGSGTGSAYSRLYVYTWVTDFGEESEPSPVSNMVDWRAGQTVTLTGFAATPGGRNITKQRIYRSQTADGGSTDLYLIAERAATSASFTDSVPVDTIAEPIPSLDFNAPPPGLEGLISLPNGVMAAFDGKRVYFCEPWQPHAWPEKYVQTVDYDVVGLGAFGANVLVCTTGQPYIIAGQHPESMAMEKLEIALPCMNAGGIVDMGQAVAYPSHEGLVTVSTAGPQIASEVLMTRENWLLMNPSTFVAGSRGREYFASYHYVDIYGFEQKGTLIIDLSGATPFVKRANFHAQAMHSDIKTGALFFLDGINVYEYDARLQPNEDMIWRSKPWVMNGDVNPFAVMQVDTVDTVSEDDELAFEEMRADLIAANESMLAAGVNGGFNMAPFNHSAINGDDLNSIPEARYCAVRLFADGKQVAIVSKFNTPVRLPSGFKGRIWQMEVTGNTGISQILMAHSMHELRSG
jgi:hypothetical protein